MTTAGKNELLSHLLNAQKELLAFNSELSSIHPALSSTPVYATIRKMAEELKVQVQAVNRMKL